LFALFEVTFFTQNGCPFLESAFSSQDQIHGRNKTSAFAEPFSGALGVFVVFQGIRFQVLTPLRLL
jgi:hypothetical protein